MALLFNLAMVAITIKLKSQMKLLNKITNGVLLVIIGLLHTQLALSKGGFGLEFLEFSKTCFFKIHRGTQELPFVHGKMSVSSLEAFSAFWFFYFGLLLIPIGLLVHSIEKSGRALPQYFTITYLVVVLIGAYMIPSSGMTFIMLPHAIYMLISNLYRRKKMAKTGK
jgi:hypothetical protein